MSLQEMEWRTIPEFPNYEVNADGQIYNSRTQTLMKLSYTNHGHVKVTLLGLDGRRYTRSVALLVACAFVDPPNEYCDTVVLLDGDLHNVCANNLVWRPRWFSWKYVRQLKLEQPIHFRNLRVANITDNIEYQCIVDAGVREGLLFADIWKSTYEGSQVFPYGAQFEITERV